MKNKLQEKIGIYSPYFSTMGGGEKYFFEIASCLSDKYSVDLLADCQIKKTGGKVFDINLDKVKFISVGKKIQTKGYDIFFYMTDGSLFFSFSRKNYLVIQSPSHIPAGNLLNRFKLHNFTVLCYSHFMKSIIKKRMGIDATVLSPYIDTETFKPSNKKENIILSVGRFFPYPHHKRQDLLIEAFKKGYKKYFTGYKLIIAGGLTEKGGEEIYHKLLDEISGYPIEIRKNLPFKNLLNLYRAAKIYWHAAGAKSDYVNHPEKVEHFGITTLEAMACGLIPVVFKAGGQTDIIHEGRSGYFWQDESELITKTAYVINNYQKVQPVVDDAIIRAKDFSRDKFKNNLYEIIAH